MNFIDFTQFGWNLQTVLLLILGAAFLVQILYYFVFFVRVGGKREIPATTFNHPISVVICAKNESKNLKQNLPKLFEQNYPEFQVVVVNDGSWDDSQDVLEAFKKQYANLHVVTIQDNDQNQGGKKLALTLGIKGAKHEHLLLTDADCVPGNENWLRNMTAHFSAETSLVIGYSPYQKKKGLLNALIRFDTFYIGLQYLSFAKAGIPYMGVGRNMAYKKSLFFSVSGFKTHYHIDSGDDDLFVREAGRKKNTTVEMSPEAHTISQPKETWIDWWRQKRRHLTTAKHYRFGHKILLSLFPLSNVLFFGTLIALMILNQWIYLVLGILLCRILLQIIIFSRAMKHLGAKDLLFLAPVLELFFLIFNPVAYSSMMMAKPNKWS